MEPDHPVAVSRIDRFDLPGEQAVAKREFYAFPRFFAGTGQAFPQSATSVIQQDDLDRGRASLCQPHEPGRDHTGIIEHQAIALMEIFRQVAEMPVAYGVRPAVRDQQAGTVPPLKRGLCNEVFRQLKVKITFFHIDCGKRSLF